ncbi:MAG: bifunctional serine/threonine-protein kinase/formylglycine-generating enzyme family protein [Myxococcota bacterium]|nr:bifunctional serine/threonine-protein kinase/formylglycine-generating enzyme family protein [Myxococcota bacterium]
MGLKPGQHIGSYEIESEHGVGGMAVVYLASHRALRTSHAIKVLDKKLSRSEEIRQRFLSEARTQAGLRHPHITPVTDVISEPGVAAIVMPFLHGEDLGKRLARAGAVPVEEAIPWILQVLDALTLAHEQGIIHRDLKPANLFLEAQPGGREAVWVMDFGIARLADSRLTRAAMTMSPLRYMSPEQIQSPRSVDARSDLFSLGAVLYELVTGQVAFDGDTDFHIQMNIVSGKYTRPSAILPDQHAALAAVIDRALATAPSDRFDSAQALAQALKQALEDGAAAREASETMAAQGTTRGEDEDADLQDAIGALIAQAALHQLKLRPPKRPSRAWLKRAGALVQERIEQKPQVTKAPRKETDTQHTPQRQSAAARRPSARTRQRLQRQPGAVTRFSLGTVSSESTVNTSFHDLGRQARQDDTPVGLNMVEAPPGTFRMGASDRDDDNDADSDERPRHTVRLRGYQVGQTPITQGQYRAIMGENPSKLKTSDQHPVERVSWFDAVRFCNALSQKCGLESAYSIGEGKKPTVSCHFQARGFRLPTEAEWECAAKSGQNLKYSGADEPDEVAWYRGNSGRKPHPVALKKPNAWGLYDMSGNVWEWVWDWYDEDAYKTRGTLSGNKKTIADHPRGPESGVLRSLRGGAYDLGTAGLRTSNRFRYPPTSQHEDSGFRVLLPHPSHA